MRVAAVDWSGRAVHARRFIWTAVASGGALHLEGDRDRVQVGDYLVDLALADPELAVGLDFGFSLPLWFLDREGLDDGPSVPEELAERWLRDCPPPFWGRRGRRRGDEIQYRRTELEVAPAARPVFQVGGSGAVGTGSLRGFALLRRLRVEGFAVWPFDAPRLPVAVEIFPRLLTGPVVKSRRPARESYLERRGWPLEASLSEDAFDAAVSALVMATCERQLATLPEETHAPYKREGRIWAGNATSGGRELELGERGARGPS